MTHITNMAKTNAAGFGVPCKAFESWIAVFEKANIDADAFFESVGLDTSYVLDFDNEIPWAKWVECVDELERRLGGRGSFEEHFRLGDILPEIDSMRVLTKFAGLFASPSFLYRVLWRWFGPSMFPGVEATLQKKERNVLVGTIEIPEGWADSPAFFRLNRAVMMEAPMLVGRGPARIELDISRRRGTYGIYLPPSGSLFDRVRRAFRSAFTGDDLLREMETQNRQLVSSYRKLERANARLQEQQRELEQNARNFRTLIERSTESIAVLADGEIIYVNEAMVGFLEYANEAELLGRPIGDILVEPDIVDLPTDSVATDNPFDPRRDIAFVNSDGDVVKGDVNKLEMEFEGRPSVVLISRDVTKRREMAARMMQMDRMIAVGTLAAGVAHEINNPLTYVVSNTDFSLKLLGDVQARLDDVGDVDESVSESLSDVHDKLNLIEESLEDSMHGGKRVKTIVRDLQTFSREEDERAPEAVNVNEVISNAVKMGWHEIRHRAELVQSLEAAEPVHVDSSRLGQVVLNLLVNAAQAIRGADASDNTIWLSSYEQDDSVVIEVEDTGKGISDEDMDQIFDPFFTTKPVGEGTGLGLSICKNLIEQMSGEMAIESEVGVGTTVTLKIPISSTEQVGVADSEVDVSEGLEKHADLSILVVDDDPMIGVSVTRLFRGSCSVSAVQSVDAALGLVADAEPSPDVVMSDVLMPGKTGIDLYRALNKSHPPLAESLLFMTGGAFSDQIDTELRKLDKPVVTKPFSLAEVLDAFDEVLG